MRSVNSKDKKTPEPVLDEAMRNSMDEDLFDARPIYPDELKAKPSTFRTVINFFRNVFSPLVNGVRSAFMVIQHAFGRPDTTSAALRYIKEAVPVSLPKQETVMSTHASLVEQEAKAGKVEVAEIVASAAPEVDSDAGDFSQYMRVYKEDQTKGEDTVCPQNFREGAIRQAQKLFDSETTRCAEYADRPKEYNLTKDEQLKLKASAALLKKQVPHPVTLKLGETREVAGNSVEQFGSFLAWREWKKKGTLPENGNIDLAAAKKYAESYIAEHNGREYLENKQVKDVLNEAFLLISSYDKNEENIKFEKILFSINAAKEVGTKKTENKQSLSLPTPPPSPQVKANGPPAPPPPRAEVAPSPSELQAQAAAKMLGLKPTDIAQIGNLVMGKIKSTVREKIIYDALLFLERQQEERFNPYLAKEAINFAQYWNKAKENQETLIQLKNLQSFAMLDQQLDVNKIEAQIPPES